MASRKLETILKMLDETQLEQWVVTYVNSTFQTDLPARRIGRKGQSQNGVDVHAVIRDIGDVGYQAKAYISKVLTITDFDRELAAAHTFMPPLKQYTVVTLNPRDAKLQEHARSAHLHGAHAVEVLALEDLVDIATNQRQLQKLLFAMIFSADDVENLLAPYVLDASSLPLKVLPIEADSAVPAELRAVEDWINAGMPRRALTELAVFTGAASQSSRRRLECRAHLVLKDYMTVVRAVESEQSRPDADAAVLALGAQAAEALADRELADEWLTVALARANAHSRPHAVSAYVRIHSYREGAQLANLESFATSVLGDPILVAAALADAAANLGDQSRSLYWHAHARDKMPTRVLGVEINEACSSVALALRHKKEGRGVPPDFAKTIGILENLAERTRLCEAPAYRFVVLNALGHAYQTLGRHLDAANAWDEALQVTEEDLGLWMQRCALSANERIPVPDQALIAKHTVSRLSGLFLASALIATARADEARTWIQRVLDDGEAPEEVRAIALVELLQLLKTSGECEPRQMLQDALTQLEKTPQALPLLWWVILHHADADGQQRAQIRSHVDALSVVELDDEHVLVLASAMAERELGDLAVAWLPRIENMAFHDTGDVRNGEAAELVADLCLMAFRFDDAIRIRERLWRLRPDDAAVVQQHAKALFESGDRQGAYDALDAAIRAGVASSRLVLNWAMLASALGHRRAAHRLLSCMTIAATTSPEDYARMLQARALIGVRGHHDEVLAGLHQGLVTPDNVGVVLGLGLRLRTSRNLRVAFGCIVRMQIAGVFDGMAHIVEKRTPPLPAVRVLDADTCPWVLDLLGARAGETVDLTRGVFQGRQATITTVHDATDWIVQQAHDLIAISAPERTGIEPIVGDIQTQLAVTKERLKDRRDAVSKTMGWATTARMPISSLAERFQVSAREFLQAGAGWTPTAHVGTTAAIEKDDAALHSTHELIFDAVTVLLLVAIGAESLPAVLPQKPGITRQAAWQLFDWYFIEREGRRAAAYLQLAVDGRLVLTDYTSRHRVAMLKHWRSVDRLVRQHFEIVDTPALSDPGQMARLGNVFGIPMVSGLAAAQRQGRVLISEEESVRGAASHIFGAKAASLQRLIVRATDQGWISRNKATLWLAALIRLGWSWVSFPIWMLDHSLRLEAGRRWPAAESFLSRMSKAEPATSIQTLLHVLETADANGYRDIDLPRLRQAIYRALPRVDTSLRAQLVKSYTGAGTSRKHRATRKMLARWASER